MTSSTAPSGPLRIRSNQSIPSKLISRRQLPPCDLSIASLCQRAPSIARPHRTEEIEEKVKTHRSAIFSILEQCYFAFALLHVILAIDQGTTGTTVFVVDARGRIRGRAYAEIRQFYPKPGWVEHDP